MEHKHDSKHSHHHYILPNKTAVLVGVALLVLTAVTVWIAGIDLGRLNFVVAMAVASVKASLVCLWFMNLKHDKKENAVIFVTSFLFLAVFIALTITDLFFRGDVYVKGPLIAQVSGKSKFKKPWVATPELIAHGKEQFGLQCASCHGTAGLGDGPAAGALNPKPRNFAQADGWKQGRKPTMVYKTLTEGLKGTAMPAFSTLSADDRWGLSHYVLSLGPTPAQDSPADFKLVGIDPNKEDGGGGAETKSIPVELAIERMALPEPTQKTN